MYRCTSKWLAIACLTVAALTSACDRVDPTAPSEAPLPSFEIQGGNN